MAKSACSGWCKVLLHLIHLVSLTNETILHRSTYHLLFSFIIKYLLFTKTLLGYKAGLFQYDIRNNPVLSVCIVSPFLPKTLKRTTCYFLYMSSQGDPIRNVLRVFCILWLFFVRWFTFFKTESSLSLQFIFNILFMNLSNLTIFHTESASYAFYVQTFHL